MGEARKVASVAIVQGEGKIEVILEAQKEKIHFVSLMDNAVFTEQGSSASQMTAARVMDVIARLLDCTGQAADAVSANTQVKMEDAPKLLKITSQIVQRYGHVFHDKSGLNHGQTS